MNLPTKIPDNITIIDNYCRMTNSIIKKVNTCNGKRWKIFKDEDDYFVGKIIT